MAYTSWSVVYGEQPSAAKWNILGTNDAHFYSFLGANLAWQSWTPTPTNFTVGNGTLTGKYAQVGKTVHFKLDFVLGTTSSVSGSMGFSPPVTAAALVGVSGAPVIGTALFLDFGTASFSGYCMLSSTTLITVRAINTAGTYGVNTATSSTVPMTWTNTDELHCSGTYEAA